MKFIPAVRASLQASYISCLISGLSSAIVSPTVTNRSTAKLTDCPIRSITRSVRSAECCRSDLCWATVDTFVGVDVICLFVCFEEEEEEESEK